MISGLDTLMQRGWVDRSHWVAVLSGMGWEHPRAPTVLRGTPETTGGDAKQQTVARGYRRNGMYEICIPKSSPIVCRFSAHKNPLKL
jgi:hypothetical protein